LNINWWMNCEREWTKKDVSQNGLTLDNEKNQLWMDDWLSLSIQEEISRHPQSCQGSHDNSIHFQKRAFFRGKHVRKWMKQQFICDRYAIWSHDILLVMAKPRYPRLFIIHGCD
jgi:hypothetical protein